MATLGVMLVVGAVLAFFDGLFLVTDGDRWVQGLALILVALVMTAAVVFVPALKDAL